MLVSYLINKKRGGTRFVRFLFFVLFRKIGTAGVLDSRGERERERERMYKDRKLIKKRKEGGRGGGGW